MFLYIIEGFKTFHLVHLLSVDVRFVVLLAKPLVQSTEILFSEGVVSLVGAEARVR